jgi:hypothetical protein
MCNTCLEPRPVATGQDNLSAISLSHAKAYNLRTKHIAIRYMYVNQIQEQGGVLIRHLSTDSIPSGWQRRSHEAATRRPIQATHRCAHGQITTSVDFKGKDGGLQGGGLLRHSHLDAAPRHCS